MDDETRYKISHLGDSLANAAEKAFTTDNAPANPLCREDRFSISCIAKSVVIMGEYFFKAIKISGEGFYSFMENMTEVFSLSIKILALESDKEKAERNIGHKIVELSRKTHSSKVYSDDELAFLIDEHRIIVKKISTLTMKRDSILQSLSDKFRLIKSHLSTLPKRSIEESKKSVINKPAIKRDKEEIFKEAPIEEEPLEGKRVDGISAESRSTDTIIEETSKEDDSSDGDSIEERHEIQEDENRFKLHADDYDDIIDDKDSSEKIDSLLQDETSGLISKSSEDKTAKDSVEEDSVEEDSVEEDSVEEDSVEEDSVEEDSVEEDSVEEDSVEEDSVEENHAESKILMQDASDDTFKLSRKPESDNEAEEQENLT